MYSLDISQPIHCYRFGRMKQKTGWEHPGFRSIAHNLFVFLIAGAADFHVNGNNHPVTAGDVLIIPANTRYKAHTDTFCEYYFFHFDGCIRESEFPDRPPLPRRFSFDLPAIADEHIYFPPQLAAGQDLRRIYNSIITCTELHARGTHTGRRMLECEFLKILLTLADITEARHQANTLPATLDRIIVYIKKNLTQPIGLDDICKNCQISASYAGRLFKKHLHTTVTEYINNEKLYYACELMRDTGMNLTEIADYLGYCDVFYFSKRFKRKFGKSPSQMFALK